MTSELFEFGVFQVITGGILENSSSLVDFQLQKRFNAFDELGGFSNTIQSSIVKHIIIKFSVTLDHLVSFMRCGGLAS